MVASARATMRRRCFTGVLLASIVACARSEGRERADTGFAGVQSRGASVMGVDQYTSRHVFESLPDGGRIVLDRDDAADTAGIRTIRAHMRDIEGRFRRGDFSLPGIVHAREVPGTSVMSAKRDAIAYQAAERPRGAELRITTRDTAARSAIHEFLAFQRSDHHAAGHEGHQD